MSNILEIYLERSIDIIESNPLVLQMSKLRSRDVLDLQKVTQSRAEMSLEFMSLSLY